MLLNANSNHALQKFKYFVSLRNKVSIALSLVVLVCYYLFILSVGLFPDVLGYRLGPSSITLGIICGIFIILLCIIVTGLYTFLANTYFDKQQSEILKQLEEENLLGPLENGEISYHDFTNFQTKE